MGAWGESSFDNDDASDWVYDLSESDDLTALFKAFDRNIIQFIFMEAPKASVIVAAAETLVAAKTGDYDQVPDEVKDWVVKNSHLNFAVLKGKALKSLRSVTYPNCELRWLWGQDKEMYRSWRNNIVTLVKKLKS